jgi:hypothetical protein
MWLWWPWCGQSYRRAMISRSALQNVVNSNFRVNITYNGLNVCGCVDVCVCVVCVVVVSGMLLGVCGSGVDHDASCDAVCFYCSRVVLDIW